MYKRNLFLILLLLSNYSLANSDKDVIVMGDIDTLSKEQKELISEEILNISSILSHLSLNEIKNKLEMKFNTLDIGKYTIDITIEDKRILFMLNKAAISYKSTRGYSEKNIENSLPSLKENKFYDDGRQWFDQRELNMAQENPLKLTLLHYELEPQTKSSDLTVYSQAPYGKHYSYVSVDNYGSRNLNYGRFSFGHINANLSGNDDIFSINTLSSFKRPEESYAIGLNYLYPFYKQHQTLGASISYSHNDNDETTELSSGLNRKTAKGNLLNAGLNWSYFLPTFDLGVKDQFKLHAGYLYRYYDQHARLEAQELALHNNLRLGLAGVSLGFSGEVKPTVNSEVGFNVHQAYYSHRIPGSHKTADLSEFGYDRSYYLTTYGFNYSQEIKNWQFKTSLEGQYSPNKVPSLDYYSLTGAYNVRGFRYTNLNADKGIIWRTEIVTPKYSKLNIRNYAFYDWGKFDYNDQNRQNGVISSTGVGLRSELVQGLNVDFFVARRLHNSKLDTLDDGKISDKTSFWGKITYGF